jgi:ATP-dependent DNA ligase
MFKAFEFCLPTLGKSVPAGPEWFHEIKYDGYRLRIERDGDRVRLITRGGYDWTRRYPRIVEAALKNRQKRFVLDGEAVILGVDASPTSTPHTAHSSVASPSCSLLKRLDPNQ